MTTWQRTRRRAGAWLRSHGGPWGSTVRFQTADPLIALTYDDGPDPSGTPGVLETLHARGATATFFMLAVRARAEPGLVRDVVAAGHEVALHGEDHRDLSTDRFAQAQRSILGARHALEDIAQREVSLFRPPYGAQSLTSFRATKASGLEPVLWSLTAADSRDATHHERVSSATDGARPGAILLCHDAFADLSVGGRSTSGPALDRGALARDILDVLDAKGLTASSVSHVASRGRAVRGLWFSSKRRGPRS